MKTLKYKIMMVTSCILFLSIFIPKIGLFSVFPALLLLSIIGLCLHEKTNKDELNKIIEICQSTILWCPFVQSILLFFFK